MFVKLSNDIEVDLHLHSQNLTAGIVQVTVRHNNSVGSGRKV